MSDEQWQEMDKIVLSVVRLSLSKPISLVNVGEKTTLGLINKPSLFFLFLFFHFFCKFLYYVWKASFRRWCYLPFVVVRSPSIACLRSLTVDRLPSFTRHRSFVFIHSPPFVHLPPSSRRRPRVPSRPPLVEGRDAIVSGACVSGGDNEG